jgi:hypothetical protein
MAWRHNDKDDHWYMRRAIIRALQRDPVAARSNGARATNRIYAELLETGRVKLVSEKKLAEMKH